MGKKYNVIAPTHAELDLTDTKKVDTLFNSIPFDTVLHTANIGGNRNEEGLNDIVKINLKIFINILRNQDKVKKIIHFGSGAEYDKSRNIVKITEEEFGNPIPDDDYGFYKYICSKLILTTRNIINLRLFGVYGKYEDYCIRFISEAICRNILGLPIIINQNVVFDYLYINDLVKIIDFFIQNSPKDKFFNVGRGEGIDLLTISKAINAIAEHKSQIIVKTGGLQNEYTCDNTRLCETIENLTFTDFKTTLKELYKYYNNPRILQKVRESFGSK